MPSPPLRLSTALALCGLLALPACRKPAPGPTPTPASTQAAAAAQVPRPFYAPLHARPIAWVCQVGGYIPSAAPVIERALEVAVYPDGTIVWSSTPHRGGPPYLSARLAPADLDRVRTTLRTDAAARAPGDMEFNVGPDAHSTVLAYDLGQGPTVLDSWHERAEAGGRIVATDRGLEPLDGRDRAAVLDQCSAAYQKFRHRWTDLRQTLGQVIPATGTPVDPADITWK